MSDDKIRKTEPVPGIVLYEKKVTLDCTNCELRSEMYSGQMNIWGFAACPHCGEKGKPYRE
jgi:hypothetical protein